MKTVKFLILLCLIFFGLESIAQNPIQVKGSMRYRNIAADSMMALPSDTITPTGYFATRPNIIIKDDSVIYVWDVAQQKWRLPRVGTASITWADILGNPYDNPILADSLNVKQQAIPTGVQEEVVTGAHTLVNLDSILQTYGYVKISDTIFTNILEGTTDSLDFKNGLYRVDNEVMAYYWQPMWNANLIQNKYVDATQPTNFSFLGWDSTNNVLRWMQPDSAQLVPYYTQEQVDALLDDVNDSITVHRNDIDALSGSSGSSTLAGLDDVTLTAIANGDYLVYNSATMEWNNVALDLMLRPEIIDSLEAHWAAIETLQGAGVGTPTLQQVLDAGSNLTSIETVNAGGYAFNITGTGSPFAVTSTTNVAGQFIFSNAVTNLAPAALRVYHNSSATTTAGFGTSIDFGLDYDISTAFANRLISTWVDADAATLTSNFDITGINGSADEVFMNIQPDYVLINNNADTVATRAYARSVGGSGGGMTNPMTTAGDIIYSSDGSGTPARLAAGTNGHVLTLDAGIPTWAAASGGGSSPAGNYGNVQLNRNGLFDTPASDSLDFDGGLKVKGSSSFSSNSGQVLVGNVGAGLGAIGFNSTLTTSNYAMFGNSSFTMINGPSGGYVAVRNNNSNVALFYGSQAQIGTNTIIGVTGTTPTYTLDVRGNLGITEGFYMTEMTAPSTPASGKAVLYTKTDGLVYAKDDAGVEKKLSNPSLTKSWSIPPTTATDNYTLFYTDVAITITKVVDVFQGTTPSYTYDIHHSTDRSAAGNEMFGTDRTATSTTSSSTTSFTDATIPAGSWVWLKASATSGTVTEFALSIIYTED